jgi:hypothetical protein
MNIFILDQDPIKAAEYYNDCHCSKIILEIAQCLSTNFNLQGIKAPYKTSHINHPVTIWMRKSLENFKWTLEHATALFNEKLYRTGKGHKSIEVINWAIENSNKLKFEEDKLTTFAIAISEDMNCRKDPEFDLTDPVKCYRLYYKHDKRHLGKWTKREIPEWYKL